MTATDNSWVAATEAKLNATYALHIQETGRQPRAPVSELGLRLISKASGPRSDRVNGSAHDVCIGSNSEVQARNWGVRFTLKNRHRQPGLSGPKSAINGSEPALLAAPKVEYSSTSSQWDVPAPSAAKHYSFIDIGFEGAISRPLYSASFGVIQPRITLGSIAERDR